MRKNNHLPPTGNKLKSGDHCDGRRFLSDTLCRLFLLFRYRRHRRRHILRVPHRKSLRRLRVNPRVSHPPLRRRRRPPTPVHLDDGDRPEMPNPDAVLDVRLPVPPPGILVLVNGAARETGKDEHRDKRHKYTFHGNLLEVSFDSKNWSTLSSSPV